MAMFFKKKKNIDPVFGEVNSMCGWMTAEKISFTMWGKVSEFYVQATAENEKDLISDEQRKAFAGFKSSKSSIEAKTEEVLKEHFPGLSDAELAERFSVQEIVFTRDGSFGIVIDDSEDDDCAVQPDAGLAIKFGEKIEFFDSQEEYLIFLY